MLMETKVRDSMRRRSRALGDKAHANTPSNSGGYPRHINDQNSKETKPQQINFRVFIKNLKFYHTEKKSQRITEKENLWHLFCVLVTLSPIHH
jgi:hypothetical protein